MCYSSLLSHELTIVLMLKQKSSQLALLCLLSKTQSSLSHICSKCKHLFFRCTNQLGGVTVRCLICDPMVVGSIPGRDTIKWLLLGWLTICGQVNHLSGWG